MKKQSRRLVSFEVKVTNDGLANTIFAMRHIEISGLLSDKTIYYFGFTCLKNTTSKELLDLFKVFMKKHAITY